MGKLDGKVAIVTGAAKGLGEADARLFALEGATVVLTDVDEENGRRVADDIGGSAIFLRQDVRHEAEWERLIGDVVGRFGRLDILVNNAGVVEAGTIENATEAEYRLVMAVSVDGTFFGCKHAVPAIARSGGGSIINMASVAAIQGIPAVTAYCTAKGAVAALTRAVAVHCRQSGYAIRCNAILPTTIDTPMVRSMGGKMVEKKLIALGDGVPAEAAQVPSMGAPQEVARLALYLASDESRLMSGQSLVLDETASITYFPV